MDWKKVNIKMKENKNSKIEKILKFLFTKLAYISIN